MRHFRGHDLTLDQLILLHDNGIDPEAIGALNVTPEEIHQLYEMIVSEKNEKSFKEIIFTQLEESHTDNFKNHSSDFERIYKTILSQINQQETKDQEIKLHKRMKVKEMVFKGLSIAAVLCIVFFLGSISGRNDNNTSPLQSKNITYSEIKAPLGARSEIILNDGTEVMLNAGSSIKYGSDFNSLNRDLILEGEAYFKVARNKVLPLIVNAGSIKIRATGTEFNVKAYSDEGIIETTLVDGEVEIFQHGNSEREEILVLEPNQKAIFANQSDMFTIEKIKEMEPLAIKPAKISTDKLMVSPKTNVEQATAWTKNKLIIRSENLESLCAKLQRKYDVTFVFKDDDIKKVRFSGTLLDETFQQVMDVIKLTAPVDYVLDGKIVTLISNKNQKENLQN
jgi:ferric-dicitrate binding protein FerR (iron transport regulator)